MREGLIQNEARVGLKTLKSIGLLEDEVLDYIDAAIEQKITGQCTPVSYFKVPHHVYLNEIGNKAMTMTDEELGHFIKKTLWTVTGKR
jgi:hypothetical protein